jgi:hypothetical protein
MLFKLRKQATVRLGDVVADGFYNFVILLRETIQINAKYYHYYAGCLQ